MSKDKYENLSPFEFKDQLIKMASTHTDRVMLNAGRGNPNFLATQPRHAFLRIGDFALQESERTYSYLSCGFGGMPEKKDIVTRFDTYAAMHEGDPGIDFIRAALAFAIDHLGIEKEDLLHEMTMAFLGCNYPVPPRMLTLTEKLVKNYLSQELCGTVTQSDEFDVFATEGATAAMTYLFQTLNANGLIKKHDKVAIITPIFSPYLEIPHIPEYELEIVEIKASEEDNWQVPDAELEKLTDPSIKLLFMVNPSNPPSVKMNSHVLSSIAKLVDEKRPDLMIVSDDVYATFSDDYRSLFYTCPYNSLCVYSFSKYFGVTGWRLGTMLLHENNVFDDLLTKLPESEKKRLDQRYSTLTDSPRALKFIDRLVADSRSVALNHTAGLSLPQQLQMLLLALFNLLDEGEFYKAEAKRLIRRRYDILYRAIGIKPEYDENSVDYYTVIDLELLSEQVYGAEFSKWFMTQASGSEFIVRLAEETSVVLLPGKGFDVEHPSARVSLANLTEFNYRDIGRS
ncbi:MAG: bifunctional aspartate transaminase/aspartate 4-decarboxylase [Gammaproteobacteria bacterium]